MKDPLAFMGFIILTNELLKPIAIMPDGSLNHSFTPCSKFILNSRYTPIHTIKGSHQLLSFILFTMIL